MGMAAAMQALKMFTQGQGSGSQATPTGSQNAFIGMAMSEAGKVSRLSITPRAFRSRPLHYVLTTVVALRSTEPTGECCLRCE